MSWSVAELEKEKKWRKFAAPELFYVFREEGSESSLQVMQKNHLYSMAADAYATECIEAQIWKEEWDTKYFSTKNKEQYVHLKVRLESLQKVNVHERAFVPEVLDILKKAPHY